MAGEGWKGEYYPKGSSGQQRSNSKEGIEWWAGSWWGPENDGGLSTEISCGGRSSVQFSCSAVSDSLRHHGLQHARPPCQSPTPGVGVFVKAILPSPTPVVPVSGGGRICLLSFIPSPHSPLSISLLT